MLVSFAKTGGNKVHSKIYEVITYIKNNKGLSMDLCSTPHKMCFMSESTGPRET